MCTKYKKKQKVEYCEGLFPPLNILCDSVIQFKKKGESDSSKKEYILFYSIIMCFLYIQILVMCWISFSLITD